MPTRFKKYVQLIYKGDAVANEVIMGQHDLKLAIAKWYQQMRPALNRGETITLEIKQEKKYA